MSLALPLIRNKSLLKEFEKHLEVLTGFVIPRIWNAFSLIASPQKKNKKKNSHLSELFFVLSFYLQQDRTTKVLWWYHFTEVRVVFVIVCFLHVKIVTRQHPNRDNTCTDLCTPTSSFLELHLGPLLSGRRIECVYCCCHCSQTICVPVTLDTI